MAHLPAVGLVFLLFMGVLVATLMILLPVVWRQTVNLVQEQLPHLLSNSEAWLRIHPMILHFVGDEALREMEALLDNEAAPSADAAASEQP